jgi:arylsulfatase A-like enzyme
MFDGAADNGPLRGGKSSVLEGGIRVPAIINWPGKLTDADYDGRLHVTDLLPTLMEAATGSATTGQLTDGKSMWSALAEDREVAPSDFVTMGMDGKAFFSRRWKLIERNNGALQLYDIKQDETESRDLASERPDVVEKLHARLTASPTGPSTSIALWRVILDPDEFGGAERKVPMADLAVE